MFGQRPLQGVGAGVGCGGVGGAGVGNPGITPDVQPVLRPALTADLIQQRFCSRLSVQPTQLGVLSHTAQHLLTFSVGSSNEAGRLSPPRPVSLSSREQVEEEFAWFSAAAAAAAAAQSSRRAVVLCRRYFMLELCVF